MPTKTYSRGGYSVTINHDGSIRVKQGDWLSKYSMAIHGDHKHVNEYLRKVDGVFYLLNNVDGVNHIDRITAGEIIYHKPSMPTKVRPVYGKSFGGTPPKPTPSINLDDIVEESGIGQSKKDSITWIINKNRLDVGVVSAVGAFVELGALGALSSVAGAALSVIGSTYALFKARNSDIQRAALRGATYGLVAWAFGHSHPFFPSAMEKTLLKATLNDNKAEIKQYKSAWHFAVSKSQADIEAICASKNINVEDARIALQASSLEYVKTKEPVPEWLAAGWLLDSIENADTWRYSMSKMERQAILSPWTLYPNDSLRRPSYPSEINIRLSKLVD